MLLPAYNAASTLDAALRSIHRQTLRAWECLIIDDGSQDETAEIAARWVARDDRMRLIRQPVNRGIAAALDLAARQARCAYIARQDADDRSARSRLELQAAFLARHRQMGAIACRVRMFPRAALSPGWLAYAAWLDRTNAPDEIAREIWVESPLPHPAVMMRRRALEECGGYRAVPWPEDYDLWLRMHCAGWRLGKLPQRLYDWRHHPQRLTCRDPRYSTAAFLACKLAHLLPRIDRPIIVWGAGRDGRRVARALIERGRKPLGFIDIDPRKIGRSRLGLPVIAAEQLPADAVVLAAVGTAGARALIRARLTAGGLRELRDFYCLH